MNILKKSIFLGGLVAALSLLVNNQAAAQQRDPSQWRQARVDHAKDQLEITNDTEWKAIEPLVSKVIEAEGNVMRARMGMMMGRGSRRSSDSNSGDRPPRRSPFGEPSPAMAALQKAIDDKAPASDLKSKLAAVRAETKETEAKLDAAQEDLKAVLTSRQEAIAVANGLLK
jgi:hypothetical protein